MNNTEKLLRAFIEAQGFDVEDITEGVVIPDLCRGGNSKVTIKKVIDYKVAKRKPINQSLGDKTGDVASIPPEAFSEAAKRDLAKGIDITSDDSHVMSLMRVQAGIK